MAIRVECPNCQAAFSAKAEYAGKKGKCPACKSVITVPASQPAPAAAAQRSPGPPAIQSRVAPTNPAKLRGPLGAARPATASPNPAAALTPAQQREALQSELLTAFRGNIARVKVPPMYRLGIALSALLMILLPLAYVAIVALTGWSVWFHATHNTALLSMGTGRAQLMMILIYAAPIAVGVILVLFMLKPLFARPVLMGRSRSLTRQAEPVLFAFVDRVCQAVGARAPSRIKVDWQLNASAGCDEGWLGFLGDWLVLTIGAPMAAGLDLGEFAGVLAHEFGHFTQGTGRRMTYLVRSISFWFLRVVYQRDEWDAWLDQAANDMDLRIGWILHLARLGVWLSRRILWLFMMMGNVVSSFLLRQMEYHADAHEARLAGGEVFETTTRKMAQLEVAYVQVFADLRQLVIRGRLPYDLSQMMLAKQSQFSAELLQEINRHISAGKTGLFDTHPASRDRIERARQEARRRFSSNTGRRRSSSAISNPSRATQLVISTEPPSAADSSLPKCSRSKKPSAPKKPPATLSLPSGWIEMNVCRSWWIVSNSRRAAPRTLPAVRDTLAKSVARERSDRSAGHQ